MYVIAVSSMAITKRLWFLSGLIGGFFMKRLCKTMFFITLFLILLFVTLTVASALSVSHTPAGGIGIIGGADGPTAILVTRTLISESAVWGLVCFVTASFVLSAIGWVATKNK